MQCGIYEIRHTASGRTYVGSSVDVGRRLDAHRALLRRGVHDNIRLQRAWNRDGEDAFTFAPTEECPVSRLRDREAEVIAERSGMVYNTSPVVRKGARASNASLSDATALAVYRRAADGGSVVVVAREFGVPLRTVERIVAGKTYTHVTGGVRARAPLGPPRGARAYPGKLTEQQARDALRRIRAGEIAAHVAREIGVTPTALYALRDGRVWKHLHADASSSSISSGSRSS